MAIPLIFESAGAANSRNYTYRFWQDNQPTQLETPDFALVKLQYLHNNPVEAGFVEKPEDYLLSSARDYNVGKGLLPIEHLTASYTLPHWQINPVSMRRDRLQHYVPVGDWHL